MQRFVRYILIFSLPILLFFTAGEWYVESLPNPARDKHQWMQQHHDEVSTLILGDSHAFYGIRPDMLGKGAFSLAMTSQTLRYDDYLLRHYDMPQLRNVILTLSYFTLWEDFESMPGTEHMISRYHIYMDCDLHHAPQYYLECAHRKEFIERMKSLYMPPRLSWDSLGWGDNYTIANREAEWDNGAERASNNTYTDTTIVRLNEGFLRSIIAFCKDHNVRLTLVSTPVTETFRRHESQRQVNVNQQVLHRILTAHPEVQYLDYEEDPRFAPDDFYDADHLSDTGAAKLTKIISEAI